MYPDTFRGFQIDDSKTWTTFHKREYTPKPFEPNDVDVQIQACGVCGSDVHTITGGWGEQKFPLCCGHEIIGKAVRVGPAVSLVKLGDRVGVGAQIYSCLKCKQCRDGNESYCVHQVDTYGAIWPGTEIVTQGGYGSHIRVHEHWVFPIPDGLPTAQAAPMLCAGVTTYSPLVRHGAGPGKKVGIVGIGGLGHYGVMFAKALGAETWAISRSHAKEADARALGADGFIATQDPDWNEAHRMTFDLIVNTANSNEGFDLERYLTMLDVHGRWISVGMPEGEGVEVKAGMFTSNGCLISATHIGSRKETLDMFQLAVDKGLKSWVEEIPISEKGLAEAVTRLKKNDVKYRFTMTGYDKQFPQPITEPQTLKL